MVALGEFADEEIANGDGAFLEHALAAFHQACTRVGAGFVAVVRDERDQLRARLGGEIRRRLISGLALAAALGPSLALPAIRPWSIIIR